MKRPAEPPSAQKTGKFLWLMVALVALLLAYPYFGDSVRGAALGGLMSVVLLTAAIFAVRTHKILFLTAIVLALVAAGADVAAMATGARGHPFVEAAFAIFYAFTTACVFSEVIRVESVTRDTIFGIISVYLLLGVTFATIYDFLETMQPGSFQVNVESQIDKLGFRNLIFYSFMTLTTVGYGDITPTTQGAQSLAILEGATGVLFVAVLVARIVGVYSRR